MMPPPFSSAMILPTSVVKLSLSDAFNITSARAGVARKCEICGALLGALMTVGLERGTERLNDFDGYVDTMVAASEVFDRFRNKYGTVKCFEIQEQLLGRSVDFFNDEYAEWWYEHGGLDKCPGFCSVAAIIAAEKIIELRNREISSTK